MKLIIKKGVTSKLIRVFIQNNSVATGAGLTGLVFNSGSLTAYYIREGDASATAITLATMTVGTWATGGFKEVDATNMPGLYEIGIPNAAIASGSNSVVVMLKGATNMATVILEIQLVDVDLQDTVRFGLTALPNAPAESAGGLYTRGSGVGQINQPANGLIDVNTLRWNGTAVATPATAGIPDVNVKNIGNTLQTARDIGASVLLSSGTGTGQLDFTSGVVKSNLVQILATALTETAGQIAAAFKQFFNIASPTSTMNTITTVTTTTNLTNAPTNGDFTATMKTSLNNATPAVTVSDKTGFSLSAAGIQAIWDRLTSALTTVGSIGKFIVDNADSAGITTLLSRIPGTVQPQTGDSYARLGAPVGASISADVAGVQSDTNDIQTRLPAALVSGRIDASVGAMATDVITATALAASAVNEIADQVWDELIAGHLGAGSTGAALNAAGSAGDPWTTPLPGAYGAGTAGNIIGNNLDAAVSSRSTLDGTGVQTALTSQGYTTTRAGYLDTLNGLVVAIWASVTRTLTAGTNIVLAKGTGVTGFNDLSQADVRSATGMASANLDTQLAAIKSDTATSLINEATINTNVLTRLPTSSYTTPPTVTQIRTEMDTNSTKLDVAVSTRLASASYTTPPTAVQNRQEMDSNSTKLANLDATVSSRSTLTAANVWTYIIEGSLTAERFMRLILASVANKLSGAATTTVSIRDVADTKNRIVATVTADGDRTSVTLDGS